MMSTTTTIPSGPTVFDHTFDGWSIWLEPDDDHDVHAECSKLCQECGGPDVGVHPFDPHVTMLYNFPKDALKKEDQQEVLETIKNRCAESFPLMMTPTDFYHFHYPKSADDGKGFGCVISMLLFDKSEWLQRLHKTIQETYPTDEREGKFTPHMSLVYAPESQHKWLQDYTDGTLKETRRDLLQPFRARYLSLWSTQGSTKEWYRITRVQL
jgi:2'-5' RNA ligase